MGMPWNTKEAAPCCKKKTVDASTTPEGNITLSSIGSGFGKDNVRAGLSNKLKLKRDRVEGSLALSDASLRNVKGLSAVVATLDVKAVKGATVNSKLDLGARKYELGATWKGDVAEKATTAKVWYSNKNNLVNGEVTVGKKEKVKLCLTQKQLQSVKYTTIDGKNTIEPSYNFIKESPALSVTRKLGDKGDSLKAAHDLKSKVTSVEWEREPFKVNLSTTVKGKGVTRPTLSATFENVYEF